MTDSDMQNDENIQDQFNELLSQNEDAQKVESEIESDDSELGKLRKKNKQLLEESKRFKDKSRDTQVLYDGQILELERLQNIEQEFSNFKADIHWNSFLNDLKIDPKFRDFVSITLGNSGYKVGRDSDHKLCIMDQNSKLVDLKHFDKFKKDNDHYFLPYINLASGGARWGDEPTTAERMRLKADQCIEASQSWLKEAERIELAENKIRDNPTPSPSSLNFGLK